MDSVTSHTAVNLEIFLYLTGPAQTYVDNGKLLYNRLFCISEGKATGCSNLPPLYASIGWAVPAEYRVGRYYEPGDEPPLDYYVFVILEQTAAFIYRMLYWICDFSKFIVSRMKLRKWNKNVSTRFRR